MEEKSRQFTEFNNPIARDEKKKKKKTTQEVVLLSSGRGRMGLATRYP